MRLRKREREVVKEALNIVGKGPPISCLAAISRAAGKYRMRIYQQSRIRIKFRTFYNEWGCPFLGQINREEVQSTRVLLMATFLHLNGEVK